MKYALKILRFNLGNFKKFGKKRFLISFEGNVGKIGCAHYYTHIDSEMSMLLRV